MQHVSTVPDTEVTKLSLPALLSRVCSCFGNLVFSICKIRANLCIGRESKNQVFLRTLLVTCKKENKTKNPVWLQVDNSYRQNISRNNCINKENWFYHQTLTDEFCLCPFQFAQADTGESSIFSIFCLFGNACICAIPLFYLCQKCQPFCIQQVSQLSLKEMGRNKVDKRNSCFTISIFTLRIYRYIGDSSETE